MSVDEKRKLENMEKIETSELVDALKDYYKGVLSKMIVSELINELNRRIEESKSAMELYQSLIESLNELSNENESQKIKVGCNGQG